MQDHQYPEEIKMAALFKPLSIRNFPTKLKMELLKLSIDQTGKSQIGKYIINVLKNHIKEIPE